MERVLQVIAKNNLIRRGETIGIGVSGGVDSMVLLHFLNENREKLDIEIVAITVDHGIRQNADSDCQFVIDYCKQNRIRCHKFSVDALKVSQQKNIGIEQAAREVRYGVFDALIKKGIVDKIALAHHQGDQAETILLHILRGAGISGASGMEYVRDNVYIRPMLDIPKDDILKYAYTNEIPNIEDETNQDSTYSRNFIRNKIMPLLRKKFPSVDQNLVNFGKACKEDDNYILSQTSFDAILHEENTVKIPLTYFIYAPSVTNRMIIKALSSINVLTDIERKHINLIKDLAQAENGKKIDLPHNVTAVKEYEYITIHHKVKQVIQDTYPISVGDINFGGLYQFNIKRTKNFDLRPGVMMMDAKKVPQDSVWRVRQKGDMFTKFGGGTKPLRAYLIDEKVPARLRDTLPVLAHGNDILCILGVEISDKVKIDKDTKMAYAISFKKNK